MSITWKITVFIGFISSLTVQADIIYLNNGDKTSGTIKEMGSNTVLINTEYVEDIEIYWKDISNLETADEVTIMKSDSTRVKGKLTVLEMEILR